MHLVSWVSNRFCLANCNRCLTVELGCLTLDFRNRERHNVFFWEPVVSQRRAIMVTLQPESLAAMEAMRKAPADREAQDSNMAKIDKLAECYTHEASLAALVEAGYASLLVEALRQHPKDFDVVYEATEVLRSLAMGSPSWRRAVLEAGAVAVLLGADVGSRGAETVGSPGLWFQRRRRCCRRSRRCGRRCLDFCKAPL